MTIVEHSSAVGELKAAIGEKVTINATIREHQS